MAEDDPGKILMSSTPRPPITEEGVVDPFFYIAFFFVN
jgi:hypothetical protein